MSVVKKAAKTSLWIFSIFVLVFIGGAVYLYVNMGSIAKQLAEQSASKALGVAVTIGDMDINLEQRKVTVSNISVANPKGYKKPQSIRIGSIIVAGESFTPDLLTLARVEVNDTVVNLEVRPQGTNLGDLKKNVDALSAGKPAKPAAEQKPKVIVRDVYVRRSQLNPSVTLVDRDLAFVEVPEIHVSGIGEKENGVIAQEAIAQVLSVVLQDFNKAANSAGFLEGLPLDKLNEIGVSTLDVFGKNLKKSYDKDVKGLKDGVKDGVDGLKNMFGQ